MFDTLTEVLAKDGIEDSIKSTITDSLFGFVTLPDQVELVLKWLEKSYIFKTGDEEKKLVDLSMKNKHSILKTISKDTHLSQEAKLKYIEKTLGEDKSDLAKNTREACLAGFPEAESKAKVWADFSDPLSTESAYTRGAKMGGFYSWKQKDLVLPYIEKFYVDFPKVYELQPFRYVQTYFYAMLPRMEVRDEHIIKLLELKLKTPDTSSPMINMLNDGIEILFRIKHIRELASKELEAKL